MHQSLAWAPPRILPQSVFSVLKRLVPLSWRPALRPWKRPGAALRRLLAATAVRRRAAGRVVTGPFAGMRFDLPRADIPKLLGTYELELHGLIDALGARGFRRIVNVGAAEGYYAVGLARRMPEVPVEAFEADAAKWPALRQLAAHNAVGGRIALRGICAIPDLLATLGGGGSTLVVMDVEGHERTLLGDATAPALATCWLLVELHEPIAHGETGEILERLRGSHRLFRTGTRPRQRGDFPLGPQGFGAFSDATLVDLLGEGRPWPQEWLLAVPRGTEFEPGEGWKRERVSSG